MPGGGLLSLLYPFQDCAGNGAVVVFVVVVVGLILTGLPAYLRFIQALWLHRTNIRVCQFHNDMDI